MTSNHMTTQELCNAIYRTVRDAKTPMSRREIATAIGRKKVPHVIRMIEHLAQTGYFTREKITDKFGREGFVYSIVENMEEICAEAA